MAVGLFVSCIEVAALGAQTMTFEEVTALRAREPERRVAYGSAPTAFGDLFLPAGAGPHPVVILIHGGCWRSRYDLSHLRPLAGAIADAGFAVWSIEYRRIGDPGGGWPGTFADVAAAADYVRELGRSAPLDTSHVIAAGHSAGGHLALWLAARHQLPALHPLRGGAPLPIDGVVSLAGIPDLTRAAGDKICGTAPGELMGGPPQQLPERYRDGSPSALLPLGVPQWLINGVLDDIVPPSFVEPYARAAVAAGDDARLKLIPHAGHFEVIAPGSIAWPAVIRAIREAGQR